jgi:hypothetical protein
MVRCGWQLVAATASPSAPNPNVAGRAHRQGNREDRVRPPGYGVAAQLCVGDAVAVAPIKAGRCVASQNHPSVPAVGSVPI